MTLGSLHQCLCRPGPHFTLIAVEAPGWSRAVPPQLGAPLTDLQPRRCPPGSRLPGGFPPRPHASPENEQGPAQGAGARRVPSGPRGPPPGAPPAASAPRRAPAAPHPGRVSRADTRGSIQRPKARTSRWSREEQGTSPPASASRPAPQGPTGLRPADSRPPPPRPRPPLHPPPSPLALAGGRMAQPSHVPKAPGVSGSGAKSGRGALQIQMITSIQIWR